MANLITSALLSSASAVKLTDTYRVIVSRSRRTTAHFHKDYVAPSAQAALRLACNELGIQPPHVDPTTRASVTKMQQPTT